MDWQIFINIGAGGLLTIGGWFARQLWDSVKELKSDMSDIRLHMSENYVKKSEIDTIRADIDKRFDKLELMISRFFDKIDQKADR